MNSLDLVKTTVASVFQEENTSLDSIAAYITSDNILYGICEESEDLTLLKESYA